LIAAEEGSFSAAARALGLAQPTVGRQIAALEDELGVTLFERIGNALELTAAGLELLEHVRGMSEAATRFSVSATGQSASLDGPVCNPTSPEELARADFFGFDRSNLMIEGLRALGLQLTPKDFPIITSNHLVQWELAKQGLGICIVMDEVGDREPRVRRVLPELRPISIPMWLITHRELKTSRRIRVVFDLLAEELRQPPALG